MFKLRAATAAASQPLIPTRGLPQVGESGVSQYYAAPESPSTPSDLPRRQACSTPSDLPRRQACSTAS